MEPDANRTTLSLSIHASSRDLHGTGEAWEEVRWHKSYLVVEVRWRSAYQESWGDIDHIWELLVG
jgi:hypothetical protein